MQVSKCNNMYLAFVMVGNENWEVGLNKGLLEKWVLTQNLSDKKGRIMSIQNAFATA